MYYSERKKPRQYEVTFSTFKEWVVEESKPRWFFPRTIRWVKKTFWAAHIYYVDQPSGLAHSLQSETEDRARAEAINWIQSRDEYKVSVVSPLTVSDELLSDYEPPLYDTVLNQMEKTRGFRRRTTEEGSP